MSYPSRESLTRTEFVSHTSVSKVVYNQYGVIEAFGHIIKDVAMPIDPLDAINKKYMDSFRLVGDTKMSMRTSDHNLWLLCDGRCLSIATYSKLYEILGTSFGCCEGRFHLPNTAGKLLGNISENHNLSSIAGSETIALTSNELVPHRHTNTMVATGAHNHSGNTATNGAHNHTITDPSHHHAIAEPGHVHRINDPSHSHNQSNYNDGNHRLSSAHTPAFSADSAGGITWYNIYQNTTGISVNSAQSGISVNSTQTGITLNNNSSGHTHNIPTDANHNHDIIIDNTGSGESFDIMQPTLFVANSFIFGGPLDEE